MRKILLAIDGSKSAEQAAHYIVEFVKEHGPIEIHLANIQPAPIGWQTLGIEQKAIDAHLNSVGHQSIKSAQEILDAAGLSYHTHIRRGEVAETLVMLAEKTGCDSIVLGTRGLGTISGIALGSVTTKVLHLSPLPVVCIRSIH